MCPEGHIIQSRHTMYLELVDIAFLTFLAVVITFWWRIQSIRQNALTHAERRCKELDLQFLDGGIALHFKGFQRSKSGRLLPLFVCHFEFSSTGDDRYEGSVHMLGRYLKTIQIPPHRMTTPPDKRLDDIF